MSITRENISSLLKFSGSSEATFRVQDEYGAHHYNPLRVAPTYGAGMWLWDQEGKKYMDMQACYSALPFGHNPPELVEFIISRLKEREVSILPQSVHSPDRAKFLAALSMVSGMNKVLPMNTGAEAVETAIKLARRWGYQAKGIPENQAEIVMFENNFHGRTMAIISGSSEAHYRRGFGPFVPGMKIVPFGDAQALYNAITPNTAAVLLERIQAEGGILLPPDGYLREVRQICHETNALMVIDGIQTELGRAGALFYYQLNKYAGTTPDLLILGKGLGGGMAVISAVLGRADVFNLLDVGSHGSTFAGNPLACAIVTKTLEMLLHPALMGHIQEMGDYISSFLRNIQNPLIKEVRGPGLLIGAELYPEAGGARRYCDALDQAGVICYPTHDNVIRFAPPFIITKQDCDDWAFPRIQKVLAKKTP